MTAAAIAKAIQPMRLPAISHSEGSALSALRIRKDMLRQNSRQHQHPLLITVQIFNSLHGVAGQSRFLRP